MTVCLRLHGEDLSGDSIARRTYPQRPNRDDEYYLGWDPAAETMQTLKLLSGAKSRTSILRTSQCSRIQGHSHPLTYARFVGEESYSKGASRDYLIDDNPTWCVDPLDGASLPSLLHYLSNLPQEQ